MVPVLAVHRAPEVGDASPERPSDFRKPLRAEHQQRDHEDENEVRWLEDVADHGSELSSSMGSGRGPGGNSCPRPPRCSDGVDRLSGR